MRKREKGEVKRAEMRKGREMHACPLCVCVCVAVSVCLSMYLSVLVCQRERERRGGGGREFCLLLLVVPSAILGWQQEGHELTVRAT